MARLLVSVRSADEARAAVSGGADIVDVKEPSAGPLGCADPVVWGEVRRVVPMMVPVSIALGEVADWSTNAKRFPPADAWDGVRYAKMGLAGSGADWLAHWKRIQSRFELDLPAECSWVAVIYSDWLAASAPSPDEVLAVALNDSRCAGVLVDTWSKSLRRKPDLSQGWPKRAERVKNSGRFLAWAGGLDIAEIKRFADSGLSPDIFAARGSACRDGNRLEAIDSGRVARLRAAAAGV